MYVNLIKTNCKSKLNDDTMAKKQKLPAEPTPLLDSAAARLVKSSCLVKSHKSPLQKFWLFYVVACILFSTAALLTTTRFKDSNLAVN